MDSGILFWFSKEAWRMISVDSFSLKIGKRQVLQDISFNLPKGEVLGISGSMGSGKTSLLYCLKAIIPVLKKGDVSGDIFLNGVSVGKKELRKDIGIVFQDPNDQIFSRTVYDEVCFGLKNYSYSGATLNQKIQTALTDMGLWERRDDDPFELSQGQKQKLALASVLAMDPQILLLDEPTASLDYRTALEVYSILGDLQKSGKTIVIVDHNTDLLSSIANRFLILDNGFQVAFGTQDIFLKPEVKNAGVKIPWRLSEKRV